VDLTTHMTKKITLNLVEECILKTAFHTATTPQAVLVVVPDSISEKKSDSVVDAALKCSAQFD
jgi:hypothetical protein